MHVESPQRSTSAYPCRGTQDPSAGRVGGPRAHVASGTTFKARPARRCTMATLTRWVLAHKRIVAAAWIVLAIAGAAAAGPASRALEPEFSVPGKEGWETNVSILGRYRGTGGEQAPLLPVVTLPEGTTVGSPGVNADLKRLDERIANALPGARIT